MLLKLEELGQASVFSFLEIQFADMLKRLSGETSDAVLAAAALALQRANQGHVCVDIPFVAASPIVLTDGIETTSGTWPEAVPWLEALSKSPLVSTGSLVTPLVLDAKGRLYLHRFYTMEQILASMIQRRVRAEQTRVDESLLKLDLTGLFGEYKTDDAQVAAVENALRRPFSAITGGPGSGKTTLLRSIVLLRCRQFIASNGFVPQTLLLAPTGKAAQRMSETLLQGLAQTSERLTQSATGEVNAVLMHTEAATIHRALAWLGRRRRGPAFEQNRVLVADTVILDESSMADLPLVHDLFCHIRQDAHIVLLGDKDQLSSVESGAVLADIFDAAKMKSSALAEVVVQLQGSHRFKAGEGIGRLAAAVNAGDAGLASEILIRDFSLQVEFISPDDSRKQFDAMYAIYKKYLERLFESNETAAKLRALGQCRILTPHRSGPIGQRTLNRMIETALEKDGILRRDGPLYPGRPIIVTRNDYSEKLFNGDVGLIAADGSNRVAVFETENGIRTISAAALPDVETVYAMTVHKSQGSEFDHVILIMPERPSPVWQRELLYTAITRARQRLTIIGTESVFKHAVLHKTVRASGLKDRLLE